MIYKDKEYLPSFDDITERAKKIFKFEPEETTEKAKVTPTPPKRIPKDKAPIKREHKMPDWVPEVKPEPEKKVVQKQIKKGDAFLKSHVYESLLNEIKPAKESKDKDKRILKPGLSYFDQVIEEDLSVTQVEPEAKEKKNTSLLKKLYLTFGMIKFQHTVFALPFALTCVLVATKGSPGWLNFFLIILAMITARNSAMTFNRVVDRHFDKKNPRTRDRAIPSGQLSLKFALVFGGLNMIAFVIISYFFNTLTFILSPFALAVILGYSLTKRVTHYTQFYLGFALGCAPMAAWIAMTGSLAAFPVILGLAVLLWVAGFDIIYATQDYEFDRQHKIKSLVVKHGIRKALMMSRIIHAVAVFFFVVAGMSQGMHAFYYLGTLLTAILLIYEHNIIKPYDLSRVNTAFFTLNGYVSLFFFIFVLLDVYLMG